MVDRGPAGSPDYSDVATRLNIAQGKLEGNPLHDLVKGPLSESSATGSNVTVCSGNFPGASESSHFGWEWSDVMDSGLTEFRPSQAEAAVPVAHRSRPLP
jgi:hypothetical protein